MNLVQLNLFYKWSIALVRAYLNFSQMSLIKNRNKAKQVANSKSFKSFQKNFIPAKFLNILAWSNGSN